LAEEATVAAAGRGAPGRPLLARVSSQAALVVYAVVLGLTLGLGSAHWATRGEHPPGGIRIGPWTVWPRVGARDADPYARAVIARSGDIPLGAGEGLALVASVDNADRPLEGNCTYRIGSATPQARYWTLAVYDAQGRARETPLRRAAFTSAEMLRDGQGRFTIVAGPTAQSGNWLPLPPGRVTFILRLYDTPVAAGSAALDPRSLPRIERVECA
jgi:hypothetical protein